MSEIWIERYSKRMYKVLESGSELIKVIGYKLKIKKNSLEFCEIQTKVENHIYESTKTRT